MYPAVTAPLRKFAFQNNSIKQMHSVQINKYTIYGVAAKRVRLVLDLCYT